MSDIVTPDVRSRMMAGIRSKDTKPELVLRSALHRLGYRYRLHNKALPGKPDLTLPKHRAVVFVNGCFWHAHNCGLFRWPRTRADFWKKKIRGNVERDMESRASLLRQNWRVLTVWECSLKGKASLPLDSALAAVVDWIESNEEFGEIAGISRNV